MKYYTQILIILLLASCNSPTKKSTQENHPAKETNEIVATNQKTIHPAIYKIIVKTESIPGDIDTLVIKSLNEPLKALTAFYAAMGGTMCTGEHCELTTALGLGKQGSEKHKALIQKYFPNDKVAETVINQDCYLRPSGASTFSDYSYLTMTVNGDTVKVDYNLMQYNRGESNWTQGPDTYLLKDNVFRKISRNLWKHSDY